MGDLDNDHDQGGRGFSGAQPSESALLNLPFNSLVVIGKKRFLAASNGEEGAGRELLDQGHGRKKLPIAAHHLQLTTETNWPAPGQQGALEEIPEEVILVNLGPNNVLNLDIAFSAKLCRVQPLEMPAAGGRMIRERNWN